MSDAVLDIRDLTVALPPGAERPHAIEGVGLALARNEILCVVGESGSGKSLTALAVMGLLPTGVRITSGSIGFDGRDLAKLDDAAMRRIRGARIGMIFQEPMTALNPVMRVGDQIGELLRFHGAGGGDMGGRIETLLASVGLPEPASLRHAYPFRLSGGQRQRVMIAMALALDPAILIADEPTTALDVTTQAQILALITSIQAKRGMGVLFITHDFGVVAEIATRVAVMRHGRLVELGTATEVLQRPQHDYTRALLAAVPRLAPKRRTPIESEITLDVTRLSKTF
ncbi:MAG: ABC transporter ATP-binding protein, partial [Alphaproteobacteria bacterium]|nr:ABC transporter ATP-binding protein [Alphaproteobacteria bacterium]